MIEFVRKRLNDVRESLAKAGKGLHIDEWKEMLEELAADIDGHLDAIRKEAREDAERED